MHSRPSEGASSEQFHAFEDMRYPPTHIVTVPCSQRPRFPHPDVDASSGTGVVHTVVGLFSAWWGAVSRTTHWTIASDVSSPPFAQSLEVPSSAD